MSAVKLILRPGIDTEKTMMLNEAGYSSCNLIRWFSGLLQKIGGWAKYNPSSIPGIVRGLLTSQDISNIDYVVAGSNQVLQVIYNGAIYDITPVESTVDLTTPFTTTVLSPLVSIFDFGSNQIAGNGVYIVPNTSVGGLILQGYYEITSVTDGNNYVITATSPAIASVSGGGETAQFTTSIGSASVAVFLEDHGLSTGDFFTVYISTTVGGLTLEGSYQATVVNPDLFSITADALASSNDVQSENNGDTQIRYLLATGNIDAAPSQGYGLGSYGFGSYGYGSAGPVANPRRWSIIEWGQHDIVASPTDGALYFWDSSGGVLANPATIIAGAPEVNTSIFLAMPQQQIIALGSEFSGLQDKLLIRWCDVGDFNTWIATSTNQAGSFTLPSGGRIVGGLQAQQQGLVWTETSLWVMQYVGPPFIYSFNEIGKGCGLIGNDAMGVLDSRVFWMGSNNFYMFDGGNVNQIPCAVWDIIFRNLNQAQVDKITCAVNSPFDEVTWYFPSSTSEENDMYVKYDVAEGLWDYGTLSRTAWYDQSIIGMPIGAEPSNGDSFIQQHEISNDADGLAMNPWAQTAWFKLNDGLSFTFIERFISDFIFSTGATVKITVYTANFPGDTNPIVYGPYSVNSASQFTMVRCRNRLASIKIESDDLGSFWRQGELVFWTSESGRR